MIALVSIIATLALFAVPALAQSAAGARYDPVEMAKARTELKASHGSQLSALILGERLELHAIDGAPFVWEGQGWIGGDLQKLWLKAEGEYVTDDGGFEEAEMQALYSRAVSPFWELQVGVRQDIKPNPSRTYAVIGAQGLAPYWFELEGAVFLSDVGDLFARLEVEYEFRLTQRLILQQRIELNAAFSDDEAIGVGSGLSTAEAGLRLRYEVTREFAPYVGVSWSRAFGDTRAFRRIDGNDTNQVSFVAGLRFWY